MEVSFELCKNKVLLSFSFKMTYRAVDYNLSKARPIVEYVVKNMLKFKINRFGVFISDDPEVFESMSCMSGVKGI